MNWKKHITATYSEVKVILENTQNKEHAQGILGHLYLNHEMINGKIICPLTKRETNHVFVDMNRWGFFNSCPECNPEGYLEQGSLKKQAQIRREGVSNGEA